MDELESLAHTLTDLSVQSRAPDSVTVCVNQPNDWWKDPARRPVCERNIELLSRLSERPPLPLKVIDRTSQDNGWTGRRPGVGLARRTLMDAVANDADPQDLIVNLDADTRIASSYLHDVQRRFQEHPRAVALAAPYQHPLNDIPDTDRAILRYEIYMRHYLLNLFRIGSPYAFTAMGSAMICTVEAYRRIGRITPYQSGEDFYFIQKLTKFGPVLQWCPTPVEPSGRSSNRVPFGTGHAVGSLLEGNPEDRWPLYAMKDFDKIKTAYQAIPSLYEMSPPFALPEFMGDDQALWQGIQTRCSTLEQFTRAAHEKLDGLRILQFLRICRERETHTLRQMLTAHLITFDEWHPDLAEEGCAVASAQALARQLMQSDTPEIADTEQLTAIRNILRDAEWQYRRQHDSLIG